MTTPNYRAMYEAARDEAEQLRGQLRQTEGELTAERLAAEQARGRDPWHPPGLRRAEGFALSCDCPGCKETRRLAGVRLLQQKIHDAEAVARDAAPLEREAKQKAEQRAAASDHRAHEANRRADAAERRVRDLEQLVKDLQRMAEHDVRQLTFARAQRNEATQAAERAIERTQRARGRARKREAAAARVLELAPYVRAALRAGHGGSDAVQHARAAVDSMRAGS
jgi:hypothetical protein